MLHQLLPLLPDELDEYLAASGRQPFTLFAPSDEAFKCGSSFVVRHHHDPLCVVALYVAALTALALLPGSC
jgi:hypothetical protein